MRTITPTRYVAPLREGGSLPALVEADDDGLYVLKFRRRPGAAGPSPSCWAARSRRLLGLPVPEVVFARLDPRIAWNAWVIRKGIEAKSRVYLQLLRLRLRNSRLRVRKPAHKKPVKVTLNPVAMRGSFDR